MMMGCEVVQGRLVMRYVKRYIGYGGHNLYATSPFPPDIALGGELFENVD